MSKGSRSFVLGVAVGVVLHYAYSNAKAQA